MARPKKDAEYTHESTDNVKSVPEFKVTRVYDPTATIERAIDAYSQDELNKLLAGGWVIKTD